MSSGSKHCGILLARFRNCHVSLRNYLFKIKLVDSSLFLFCPGNIEETIPYFLLDCPKYIDLRNVLKTALNNLNVQSNPISLSILLDGTVFFSPEKIKNNVDFFILL